MDWIIIIKVVAICIMGTIVVITGLIPIYIKGFIGNKRILSYAMAFSGGLFVSVGLIHILFEANENFENYYKKSAEEEKKLGAEEAEEEEHFPFAFAITVFCFALILFIEKIMVEHHHMDHDHEEQIKKTLATANKANEDEKADASLLTKDAEIVIENDSLKKDVSEADLEEDFKKKVRPQDKIAQKLSMAKNIKKSIHIDPSLAHLQQYVNPWTPYILQLAIGIHAICEGLAIGIESEVSKCLAIFLVVICHKWAEGITLGLSFANAKVDKRTSSIMIGIQACMNPLGISIGWMLSHSSDLVIGIMKAISAGTFVYIGAVEVTVEEFSIARYKKSKFLLFLIAIGFVCSLFSLNKQQEENNIILWYIYFILYWTSISNII